MADLELDEQEKAILWAFGTKIELTEAKIKEKVSDISKLERLQAKDLIHKVIPQGRARSIKWVLTERGQQVQLLLKDIQPQKGVTGAAKKRAAGKKKAAARKPKPAELPKQEPQISSAGITMEDVIQAITRYCSPYFERYNKAIEELSEKINHVYGKGEVGKPSIELSQFQRVFRETYETLNMKNNYGDVVPIPVIRQALQAKLGGHLTAEELKEYLLKLEEKRVIDLQIASDPSKVPNPQEGIQLPQRGVIYYVTWRQKR